MSHAETTRRRQRGFTLVEALVTVAVLGILLMIGLPSFLGTLTRTQLTGTSRQLATLFQVARLEAIKRNTPVKVLYERNTDTGRRRFWAFLDTDRDGAEDSGERRLNDVVEIPRRLLFRGPGDTAPEGPEAIDNWDTLTPATNGPSFQFDGSVDDLGAFRIGDAGDNIIEIRISSAATGRVVLRKWDRDATKFYELGQGGTDHWPWY